MSTKTNTPSTTKPTPPPLLGLSCFNKPTPSARMRYRRMYGEVPEQEVAVDEQEVHAPEQAVEEAQEPVIFVPYMTPSYARYLGFFADLERAIDARDRDEATAKRRAGDDKTRLVVAGSANEVNDVLARYDKRAGKPIIDPRGMTWTSIGKANPGYWVNARGVYRHRHYLSNMIAKESK